MCLLRRTVSSHSAKVPLLVGMKIMAKAFGSKVIKKGQEFPQFTEGFFHREHGGRISLYNIFDCRVPVTHTGRDDILLISATLCIVLELRTKMELER